MLRVILVLAQFIYILWPLFVLTALVYSLQLTGSMRRSRNRRWRRALTSLGKRIRNNLLMTWIVLFVFWSISLLAPGPTPTLLPEPWNTGIFLSGFLLLVLAELTELGFFERRLRAHVDLHHAQSIADLKSMDPTAFEILVSETYRMLGYRVQHIGKSGDHGVDVELRTKEGGFWVVQCKRYNGTVGERTVRELYGTMIAERADRGVLVTTAEISAPARVWARGKPIDLVDGRALLGLMERARKQAAGSWIDRAALFLEGLLVPRRAPPALRAAQVGGTRVFPAPAEPPNGLPIQPAGSIALPRSNGGRAAVQYQHGVPICPNCGVAMLPHPLTAVTAAQPAGRPRYRCRNYPQCRIVLEAEPAPPPGAAWQ